MQCSDWHHRVANIQRKATLLSGMRHSERNAEKGGNAVSGSEDQFGLREQ
jgi:hypothetical protein